MELQPLLLLQRVRHYETASVLRVEPAPSVRGILEAAGGWWTRAARLFCTTIAFSVPP
jgi:hypothetical protein